MWSLAVEYILLESDELEIKDFGKFSAKNTEAQILDKDNKIIPANRILSFVPAAEHTTAEFITFITKKLKISRPEALKLIEKKVNEAKEKLKKGEKIILPNVGYLFSPDKEKITLVQTNTFSLHPENFGFSEITIPPLKETQQESKTQKPPKTKAKKTKEKTPKSYTPKKKKTKKSINWNAVLRTTVILTAIAAVIVLMIAFFQPIIEFSKSLLINTPDTEKIVTKKTPQQSQTTPPVAKQPVSTTPQQKQETTTVAQTKTVEKQAATSVQDSEILASFNVKAKIPVGQNYKKYYPIVGSFINKDNAEKFRQQLIAEGFTNAVILSADNNRHRVSIGGYDNLQEVIKAKDLYLKKHPGAGIWLLINEPNGN